MDRGFIWRYPPVMTLRERLALNIRDERQRLGVSQETLALRAKVSRAYIGRIENMTHAVGLDMLEKIAQALSVDPSKLMEPRIKSAE